MPKLHYGDLDHVAARTDTALRNGYAEWFASRELCWIEQAAHEQLKDLLDWTEVKLTARTLVLLGKEQYAKDVARAEAVIADMRARDAIAMAIRPVVLEQLNTPFLRCEFASIYGRATRDHWPRSFEIALDMLTLGFDPAELDIAVNEPSWDRCGLWIQAGSAVCEEMRYPALPGQDPWAADFDPTIPRANYPRLVVTAEAQHDHDLWAVYDAWAHRPVTGEGARQ